MKNLILSFLLLFSLSVSGQVDLDLKKKLPVDDKVSMGVLDNGMTYYVRANDTPKNRAELLLVVKTGSVDEDDDQKGLAHFTEHMAFNGTKNFPKNDLIKYFESIGMEFGADVNAYTSFDETVYMLQVPLDSAKFMNKGLQVLYDWASQIDNETEEINKERGVITEEWRSGRGASERMMKDWLPVLMQNSKYAERLPIGKYDIIQNFDPVVLRRYYNDWYRPDLQAIIVVGDFDQQEMVQQVKEKFSAIKKRENTREKVEFDVPEHKETLVAITTDKEQQYPIVQLIYKKPQFDIETIEDYRQSLVHDLYNGMINKRLSEITQQANPPFVYAGSNYSPVFGPVDAYQITAVSSGDKLKEGLEAVLKENQRVKKFGFTESEFDREKNSLLTIYEKYYKERDKNKSINYANEYKSHFLTSNSPIPGIEKEFEYVQKLLPTISIDEVNTLTGKWITDDNLVVIVMAPEKEGVTVPTEAELRAVIKSVENSQLAAYEDKTSDQPLLAKEPTPSKVVNTKKLDKVDAVEWTLANGAKVVYKKTDFKSDEILFTAWSPGGASLYGQEDDISAQYAASIMSMSGIGEFDNIAFQKKMSGKVVRLSPFVSNLKEGFNGSSSVEDLETMLQLVYLYFTQPRFDETSYQSFMSRMTSVLENKSVSPEAVFSDSLQATLANNHPRSRPMTKEILSEADFNRIAQIAKERFNNAADYKFFFVGNIDESKLQPMVEKYIGGIPHTTTLEQWKDLGIEMPEGKVEKVVKKGTEPKSIQYIVFHGDANYTPENKVEINALSKILTTKLLEVIREDNSDVYSISSRGSISKYPNEEYTVGIYYGTAPEKLDITKENVFKVINDFKANGPTAEELEKAQNKMYREREVSLRENRFWLNTLSNTYYLNDGDFSQYGNYNDLVKSLTPEKLKNAFVKYFDYDNYISVALQPEE